MTVPPGTGALEATQQQVLAQLQAGGTSGTQYTDGAAAPTHPIGTEIVFNNAGTMTAVSAANGLPITGSISASNPSVGTDGSASPTSSTAIGASDGTNLQQLLVESSSNKNLRVGVYQGANELAVDASGRLTLVPNQAVNMAQVAGVAPGLDNTNELRVSLYGKNAAAGDTPVLVDSSGDLKMTQQASGSVSGTLQNAQSGNNNGSTLSVLGMSSVVLTVNMTGFTGTVNFEGSEDGVNFSPLTCVQLGTNTVGSTTTGSTTTAIALFETSCSGLQLIRARTSGVSAGSVTVTGHAVPVPYSNRVINASLYGKNVTAGDTALSLDASGRAQNNVAQWNGAAPSVTNPVITEDQIRAWCVAGKSFSATTGKQTGPASTQVGMCIFNNATAKNILLYSIRVGIASSSVHQLNIVTVDPALSGITITASNSLSSGGASSVATLEAQNTAVTTSGTMHDMIYDSANSMSDFLGNGECILLPAGVASGVLVLINVNSNTYFGEFKWIEY